MINYSTVMTAVISLIPALGLAICIFSLDRLEKEPVRRLLMLFIGGAVIYFPVTFLRPKAGMLIDTMMSSGITFSMTSVVTYTNLSVEYIHRVSIAFFAVAFIEETGRWLVVNLLGFHSTDYDCFFDGIVYGAFTALGFAVCESLFYAMYHGTDTFLLNALGHLPIKLMFGVVSGLFLSCARGAQSAGQEGRKRFFLSLSLIIPMLLHGVYEFIRSGTGSIPGEEEIIYIVVISVISLVIIGTASRLDHYYGDVREEGGRNNSQGQRGKKVRKRSGAIKAVIVTLYFIMSLLVIGVFLPILSIPENTFTKLLDDISKYYIERQQKKEEEQIENLSETDETSDDDTNTILDADSSNDTDTTNDTDADAVDQKDTDTTNDTDVDALNQNDEDTDVITQTTTASYIRYDDLTEVEKRMYEAITGKLEKGEVSTKIESLPTSVSDDNIMQAVNAVYYDHPEFFWINGGYTYRIIEKGDKKDIEIENQVYDYWNYTTDRNRYISKVKTAADEIVSQARRQPNPWDQVKYIHDYLCRTVVYDTESYKEIGTTLHKSKNWEYCHTVYGCLVNHLCVCDGYTKTFQMLLEKLGIPCYYTEGMGLEGRHAWNYLMLEDDYYYMDITWDDPDRENDSSFVMYNYYCTTYDQIQADHTIDASESNFWYPECSAVTCNYFMHEGLYLTDYNLEALTKIIESNPEEQVLAVRFSTPEIAALAVQKLMNEGDLYKIMDCESCMYYYDDGDVTLYVLPI